MRILMVGSIQGLNNFHKYFMIPEKLMNGFIQSGHAVYGVNDRDVACYSNIFRSRTFGTRAFNAYLLKAAEAFAPDLVVIGNAEKLSDESIRRMRYLLPASRFVYVNVDSLSQAGNLQKINRKVGVVDAIFVTTEVGAHNGISHSPATLLCFMPNPVDKRIDQERAFEANAYCFDAFFAGNTIRDMPDLRGKLLLQLARHLHHLHLSLGFFGSACDRPALLGRAYVQALGRSKVGLSLDRENVHRLYASDRMAHYLANGLLTCIRRGKGFEEWFTSEEVAFFSDVDDLARTVEHFTADDAHRTAVAEAGWRKIHDNFSSDIVARYLVEKTFEQETRYRYLWAN